MGIFYILSLNLKYLELQENIYLLGTHNNCKNYLFTNKAHQYNNLEIIP